MPETQNANASLRGKITSSDLGSRIVRTTPDQVAKHNEQKKTRQSLGPLYSILSTCLPDVSQQVLDSVVSIVVDIVRDGSLKQSSKQGELEQVLGPLQVEQLSQINAIVQALDQSDDEIDIDGGESESEPERGSDNESSDSDSSLNESDSDDSDSESDPWKTNPHFIKNLIKDTGFSLDTVVSALELGNMPDLPVDIANQLGDEVLLYHKYLNAENGPDRERALAKLPKRARVKRPTINLEALTPSKQARFHADPNVDLPTGTEKSTHSSYEQYSLPPTPPCPHTTELVPITALAEQHRAAFKVEFLNIVQSKVFEAAYLSQKNLLLCSPTGSGKTNVALLTILQAKGTIVYVSPLKALVQEQVRTFTERLAPLGLTVAELTGDSNLTRAQLENTNLIVTTPEKWDVVSRRGAPISLLIVDEVHLLHDPRGPAIENIVARYKLSSEPPRIVGLSATLPNYSDVAAFLNADCFYFDASYRPCPLALNFVGVTERSPFKQHQALNDILLEKLALIDKPTIVFVHSRKDTLRTALFLKQLGLKAVDAGSAGQDLAQALACGVGIHHAGMTRDDRSLAESLFAARKLKVLVSTATLAWGVNLPAHAVIIKGTQIYDPQEGQWIELSPQDVVQMLGRAGRPGFDTHGQGYILTIHNQLAYYMSILTSQFPIESQLMARLLDSLNAEVASGTIATLEQGVAWLGQTYYFQRLKAAPQVYRAGIVNDKEYLDHRRLIIHSALRKLHKLGMVEYKATTQSTPRGRIASQFYISPMSMALYAQQLKPYFSAIDVFRVFARSKEFENMSVNAQEQVEIDRLANMVPIPIKDKGAPVKVSVLLQACISRASLEGYSIAADMVYIKQSASRLFRAIFELAVAMGWSQLAFLMHDLYLEVDKQLWLTSSPFRQWPEAPESLVRRTENSPMPWSNYLELDREEVGALLRENADMAWRMLREFPRLEASVVAQPLSPTLLRIVVDLAESSGSDTPWIVLVCDGDGEFILHKEKLTTIWNLTLVVPLLDPPSPVYFVHLINDSWLHAKQTLQVDLSSMIVPKPFVPPTPVKQLEVVDGLNLMQSQVYHALKGNASVFVGMLEDWTPLLDLVSGRVVVVSPEQPSRGLWVPFNAQSLPTSYDVLVVTHAHLIGSQDGHQLEQTIVRLKQQMVQDGLEPRIVVFSYPVAGWDLARWLGVPKQNIFNYKPSDSVNVVVSSTPSAAVSGSSHTVYANDLTAVELLGLCKADTHVVCPERMLDYYQRFTRQPLPVESNLMYYLDEALMLEAARGTVISGESALDWLSYSYFFYRLRSNPTYYGATDTSEDGINGYLSELVETALEDNEFVEVLDEELNIEPLDGARIAAHWGVSLASLQVLWTLNGSSNLEEILRKVSECEFPVFNSAPLRAVQSKVPFYGGSDALLLLQVYLSRCVPAALEKTMVRVVNLALRYTCAVIDILSSQGALNVLVAVDLHQMLMQALWARESPLKQIPFVDDAAVQRAKGLEVTSMNDFLAIEDDSVRTELLGFDESDERIAAVAEFANDFPSIELVATNDQHVSIERDSDPDAEYTAHTFSGLFDRKEQWYLFVGDVASKQLLQVQKLRAETNQQVPVPHQNVKVWCICISYLDADREIEIN